MGFDLEVLLPGRHSVKATILFAIGYVLWFIAGAIIQTAIILPIGWLTAPG